MYLILSNELFDFNHNSHHNSETELEISDEEDMISEDANMSSETNSDECKNENIDFVFENDKQKEKYVILSLHEWALSGGILSMSKIDKLLTWLCPVFPNLPKSYKTLLGTPDDINIINFRRNKQ